MPPSTNAQHNPLSLTVIGAGAMGLKHMRAACTNPAITLSAVFDRDEGRCKSTAEEFACIAATSLENACELAEAAVVATPTNAHYSVAIAFLNAGLHCIVEKPLAPTEPQCQDLIDSAAINNLVLQVGHSERFNPALEALWNQNLKCSDIRAIEARRMNPEAARPIRDDEILDLMVHDLDVILALKRSPILEVSAHKISKEHSKAILTFADGTKATLSASRKADRQVRDLEVVTNTRTTHVDYSEQRAWITYDLNRTESTSYPQAMKVESRDPLQHQLTHFAESIRGEHPPRVSGEHALATMKLAWRIQAALKNAA